MTALGNRRWWLTGLVVVWIAGLVGLTVWSVGHDRATVPEQRDIDLAVTDLERAAGVVYATASGADRAVVLGELQLTRDCRITPVRSGVAAARAVTVYVGDSKAAEAVEAIAAELPVEWAPEQSRTRAGTRVSLHADAGNFVGIDLSGPAVATTLTLRLTTGCRPLDGAAPVGGDATASPAPALLNTVVSALDANVGEPVVRTVACPSGGVAGSWTVPDLSMPDDLPGRLRQAGGEIVHADDAVRAYRKAGDSIVVLPQGEQLSVTVSTSCRGA
ncbi:hypothetical protein M1L60_18810 [Actinoplanes sp. TRM 88003]|uniref:Uncharacterized protein n=1 Tax=Paractinoplanes aksuensis TaxID=2939490 RepID=A0ABT1DRK3_9ACTN|nr:hypothetical protein [Actinoplanes aksuensis]MCO8272650.1 hypothetical protein [Actinoplanes aksuensis]